MCFSSVGACPKKKTHLIYYSVYSVKSGVIMRVQLDFWFHMIAVALVWNVLLRFQTVLWSDLICSSNHSRTVMARNVTLRLLCWGFASDSLAVSNYYVIAVCFLSDRAVIHLQWRWCVGVGGIRSRCVWMTPNVSTLEHLSALKFLSGRWLCMLPGLSNSLPGKSATFSQSLSGSVLPFFQFAVQCDLDRYGVKVPHLWLIFVWHRSRAAAALPGFSPWFGNGA